MKMFRMSQEEIMKVVNHYKKILADLNTKINSTAISKFKISRSRLQEGAKEV